jgi:GTP-binding protein HflX
MPKRSQPTLPPSERAFLVGVQLRDDDHLFTVEDSLAELALLSDTAGMEVVGDLYQKIDRPDPNTFIGSGKFGELFVFVFE